MAQSARPFRRRWCFSGFTAPMRTRRPRFEDASKSFAPFLGLLDVAWRALDDPARRTTDALVRLALGRQPLPGTALALERAEIGISAAPAGLSPMLVGWSISDYAAQWPGGPVVGHLMDGEVEGEVSTPGAVRTTTLATSRVDVVANAETSMWEEKQLVVDDDLLENVDFDESLSQQI